MTNLKNKEKTQFKNCHRCLYFWNITNSEDSFTCGKCLKNNNFIDDADKDVCGDFKNEFIRRRTA